MGLDSGEGLFAAFCGKMINPLVVKDSFLRGSQFFSPKVAKKTPLGLRDPENPTPPPPGSRRCPVWIWGVGFASVLGARSGVQDGAQPPTRGVAADPAARQPGGRALGQRRLGGHRAAATGISGGRGAPNGRVQCQKRTSPNILWICLLVCP